jgi:hypothetical protein
MMPSLTTGVEREEAPPSSLVTQAPFSLSTVSTDMSAKVEYREFDQSPPANGQSCPEYRPLTESCPSTLPMKMIIPNKTRACFNLITKTVLLGT